jgi:hypothetical protein
MGDTVRIASGSAYAEDRIDLAVEMVERGRPRYLCMDGLAERTLAMAQLRRLADPEAGSDLRMREFASELVPAALRNGTRIVTNMGAANPEAAGEAVASTAKELGVSCRVAVISGDDVRALIEQHDPIVADTGTRVSALKGELVSANAYTGADAVVEALRAEADVVIGGRLADPSLFVGALVHEFGIEDEDWDALGRMTLIGHLLECGAHVTGGNFADPPHRVVPSFRHMSFPMADVKRDGSAVIRKLPDTDGLLSVETCKVQLAYEIGDPAAYLTPDVTADFRDVQLAAADGGVAVHGAAGTRRPDLLKVMLGVSEGFVGEGQVSWAGPGALDRAALAEQMVREWLEDYAHGDEIDELRFDLLGVNALHGAASPPPGEPHEVHLRVASRCATRRAATTVAQYVEYVQVYGPAATGGHRKSVKPQVSMYSAYLPRELVTSDVKIIEV